jgi:predicted signal transduction protein with EAL and GGDEF domain
LQGREVRIGTSIGIAVSASQCLEPEKLIRQADIALYRAKAEGTGYLFFKPSMEQRELRQAAS